MVLGLGEVGRPSLTCALAIEKRCSLPGLSLMPPCTTGMHVDAPGSKFRLLHLVSSLSEADQGGGPLRPWQQALLFRWRILKFQCLEHGLTGVAASLVP